MESAFETPTAELLLDTKTPAELALSPDGSRLVFSLHATVADVGSYVPCDLYVVDTGSVADPVQLTDGAFADVLPAWSPDGSRLAFLSDRITSGHQLPYTMPAAGGEPTLAATLTGSAESVAWSGDGRRLLVLAADPGSYGLDWGARAVRGAEPESDPVVRRPGDARRRLLLIDLGSGNVTEVGPPDLSIWEVDWDGDHTAVAVVATDHTGSGWYQGVVARLDLQARTAHTLYEPEWQMEGLERSPDGTRALIVEGYASDHGLLAGSIMVIDVATGETSDPWPDLQSVGLASWCDDDSIWYASTDGTGNACGRIWLDGRQEERWRDDAFIGDAVTTPACVISEGAADVWTTHQAHATPPELARFDHDAGSWVRRTRVQRSHRAGTRVPRRTHDPMDGRGRRRDRGRVDDAARRGGAAAADRRRPRRPHVELGVLLLRFRTERGAVGLGGLRVSAAEPAREHRARPRLQPGRDRRRRRDRLPRHHGRGRPRDRRGHRRPRTGLGIAGLSYGGYMAAWAVGQTDRFGASVAMSVVSNYLSFHLTSEVWWYDHAILEGDWHDPASQYMDRSPVTHAHKGSTPTLILQGAIDRCTPVSQADELFTAIAETGTEVELVVYPREGHVPLERAHALDAIRRTQEWFDRHL